MASYPSFQQLRTSERAWVDDVRVDRAENGNIRGFGFYTAKKAVLTLRHILSAADLATLLTFYDTNRLLSNSVTWQGTSTAYPNVWFVAPPKEKPVENLPGYFEVEVQLAEQ